MSVNAGSKFRLFLFLGSLVAAGVLFGPTLAGQGKDDGTRKVTFDAQVGDGKTWAGGFTVNWSIGSRPQPTVTVQPLGKGDKRKNTWIQTKTVKAGTAVSMHVRADWSGVPIRLQLRGAGINARPVFTTSPFEPVITGVAR